MTEENPPPTFVDNTLASANLFAQEVLQLQPEVRSVIVLLDWRVPSHELPFGIMVSWNRQTASLEDVRHPVALMGCMSQTRKMLLYQIEAFKDVLKGGDEAASQLAKTINEKKQQIVELDQLITKRVAQIKDLSGD